MRVFGIFALCLVVLFSAGTAFAQGPEESGMIKTEKGVLVVWNEPGNFFTIEIKGTKIEAIADHDLWFTVDGKFLQIVTVRKTQFMESAQVSADNRTVLNQHRDWESKYVGEVLNAKINVVSSWTKLSSGADALAWSYDMPTVHEKQTAKKQLYLGVVKRDHVFLLNRVIEGNDDEKAVAKYLVDTMSTLRSADKPTSLKAASEQIKKGGSR